MGRWMRRWFYVALLGLSGALMADLAWGTDPLAEAVSALQPRLSARSAASYGKAFERAGEETGIDPILLLAIAYRESSLHPAVARGEKAGRLGEIGLMQVMPNGFAQRFAPGGCSQREAGCSIHTAARFLQYLREERCGGSWWRWVGAYGWSRCPTEAEARRCRSTKRAHELYLRAGGDQWE